MRKLRAVDIQHAFCRVGVRLHERAQGDDAHPVESDQPMQSVPAEDTFERDVLIDDAALARRGRTLLVGALGADNEVETSLVTVAEDFSQYRRWRRRCSSSWARPQSISILRKHRSTTRRSSCWISGRCRSAAARCCRWRWIISINTHSKRNQRPAFAASVARPFLWRRGSADRPAPQTCSSMHDLVV